MCAPAHSSQITQGADTLDMARRSCQKWQSLTRGFQSRAHSERVPMSATNQKCRLSVWVFHARQLSLPANPTSTAPYLNWRDSSNKPWDAYFAVWQKRKT